LSSTQRLSEAEEKEAHQHRLFTEAGMLGRYGMALDEAGAKIL